MKYAKLSAVRFDEIVARIQAECLRPPLDKPNLLIRTAPAATNKPTSSPSTGNVRVDAGLEVPTKITEKDSAILSNALGGRYGHYEVAE